MKKLHMVCLQDEGSTPDENGSRGEETGRHVVDEEGPLEGERTHNGPDEDDRVDGEDASGGEDEIDASDDMVIAILILVRMMKFNFN
jgi:hypothetical protein